MSTIKGVLVTQAFGSALLYLFGAFRNQHWNILTWGELSATTGVLLLYAFCMFGLLGWFFSRTTSAESGDDWS